MLSGGPFGANRSSGGCRRNQKTRSSHQKNGFPPGQLVAAVSPATTSPLFQARGTLGVRPRLPGPAGCRATPDAPLIVPEGQRIEEPHFDANQG